MTLFNKNARVELIDSQVTGNVISQDGNRVLVSWDDGNESSVSADHIHHVLIPPECFDFKVIAETRQKWKVGNLKFIVEMDDHFKCTVYQSVSGVNSNGFLNEWMHGNSLGDVNNLYEAFDLVMKHVAKFHNDIIQAN